MNLKKLVQFLIGFISEQGLYNEFITFIEDQGYTKEQIEKSIEEVNN